MSYWLNQLTMDLIQVQPKPHAPFAGRHPSEGWVMAQPQPMPAFIRRALRGIVRAVCPPEPAPQLVDLEDRIEDHLRRFIRYMPGHVRVGFCVAILLIDWAPLWRFTGLRRLQHLGRARAAALLAELSVSRSAFLRTTLLGVRGSILSTYYDQDEVHLALGYAPAAFIAGRIDLRTRLLARETSDAREIERSVS
jgi:hypothetical protein